VDVPDTNKPVDLDTVSFVLFIVVIEPQKGVARLLLNMQSGKSYGDESESAIEMDFDPDVVPGAAWSKLAAAPV
jgi:hypothetical protein